MLFLRLLPSSSSSVACLSAMAVVNRVWAWGVGRGARAVVACDGGWCEDVRLKVARARDCRWGAARVLFFWFSQRECPGPWGGMRAGISTCVGCACLPACPIPATLRRLPAQLGEGKC